VNITTNTIRTSAELAFALKLAPVPIRARSKVPAGGTGWQQKDYTLDDFEADGNIGLHLKSATRLVDADLDSVYARALAPRFLPDTKMKYGRPSKPASHWMYVVDDIKAVKHAKFNGLPVVVDNKKVTPTLLERRTGDGKQTVIPPSMHESGETITYVDGGAMAPTQVAGKALQLAFNKLAVASLIGSVWGHGIRHDLALAVPAFMLKSGVSADVVSDIVTAVVEEYSEGGGVADGLAALKSTIERFENDPESVSGATILIERISEARTFMKHVTSWLDVKMSRVESARAAIATSARGKPVMLIGDSQWSDLTDDAYHYLVVANHEPTVGAATADVAPVLFQRGGELQRVRIDLDSGRPVIMPIGKGALRERLSRVADWTAINGVAVVPAQVPEFIAANILCRGTWPEIPSLKDVTETPLITSTGEIVVTPGYQPACRLWYHPTVATMVPPVAEEPTIVDAFAARDAMLDVIVDFAFAKDGRDGGSASRTHALAFMLLPFMRELIDGPTPMHLIDAPTPGSGKSLLADVVARIATGRAPRSFSWTKDGDEIRKTITSFLIANAGGVIGVDNIAGTFASPVWAKILTDTVWTERLLGTNTLAGGGSGVPIRATWYGTGNNVQMSNEASRRVLWIRLVPDCERPEDRTGFQHDPLVAWVMAERGRLIHAALTLARFAFQSRTAGRLPSVRSWGSYEAYSQLMGGLMVLLDMTDWDRNREALRESRDDELGPWRALILAWVQAFGNQEVTGKELFAFAQERGLLPDVFADQTLTAQSRLTGFGKALQHLVDRVVDGHQVAKRAIKGVSRYRVRPV
jgi:hypothetical protein